MDYEDLTKAMRPVEKVGDSAFRAGVRHERERVLAMIVARKERVTNLGIHEHNPVIYGTLDNLYNEIMEGVE